MSAWADKNYARDNWADAPIDDDILDGLLNASQEVVEVYAPTLADGATVPERYAQAVVLQAREIYQASYRDGDVIGFDDFAIRAKPLGATVKQLLRPRKAVPVIG